jgi:hypothetical protein
VWLYQLDHGSIWSCVVGSSPCQFTARGKAPNIHYVGGWLDPRAGLDAAEKRSGLIKYFIKRINVISL